MLNFIQFIFKTKPLTVNKLPREEMNYIDPKFIATYYDKSIKDPTYSPLEALYQQADEKTHQQLDRKMSQGNFSHSTAVIIGACNNGEVISSTEHLEADNHPGVYVKSDEIHIPLNQSYAGAGCSSVNFAVSASNGCALNVKEAISNFKKQSSMDFSYSSHVGSYKNRPVPSAWPDDLVRKHERP